MQLLNDASAVGGMLGKLMEGGEDEGLLGLQLCFDIVDSGDQKFVNGVAEVLPKGETGEGVGGESTIFNQAHKVLTEGFTSELALSFLYKNTNADPLIMSNLKKALEERGMGRNSMLHNCAVTAHGYLNVGTTCDGFLRDNLDWMKKASNW
jgi:26S proteasome regulatory subunit N2